MSKEKNQKFKKNELTDRKPGKETPKPDKPMKGRSNWSHDQLEERNHMNQRDHVNHIEEQTSVKRRGPEIQKEINQQTENLEKKPKTR